MQMGLFMVFVMILGLVILATLLLVLSGYWQSLMIAP